MLANKKPWGHELLAYQNENVAIWHLFLNPWEETSLHCHPNKKTGLVVLEGGASVAFLSGENKLFAGEKIMIRQGVFHKSRNRTAYPLQLFEIETPVQKDDLVRLEDRYSRPSSYGPEPSIEIQQEYPWNDWGASSRIGTVKVGIEDLNSSPLYEDGEFFYDPASLYMVIQGGVHKDGIYVCGPGDVISASHLETLTSKFTLDKDSLAIRIRSEH